MNATRTENIRLEYRLPAQPADQLASWQANEVTRFPTDAAQQARRNHAELQAKASAGLLRRRAQSTARAS